jgi:hypothetical protein
LLLNDSAASNHINRSEMIRPVKKYARQLTEKDVLSDREVLVGSAEDFLLARKSKHNSGLARSKEEFLLANHINQKTGLAGSEEDFLLDNHINQKTGLAGSDEDFLSAEVNSDGFAPTDVDTHSTDSSGTDHPVLDDDFIDSSEGRTDPADPPPTYDPLAYYDLEDVAALNDVSSLESNDDLPWSRRNDKVLLLARGLNRRTFTSESENEEVQYVLLAF